MLEQWEACILLLSDDVCGWWEPVFVVGLAPSVESPMVVAQRRWCAGIEIRRDGEAHGHYHHTSVSHPVVEPSKSGHDLAMLLRS